VVIKYKTEIHNSKFIICVLIIGGFMSGSFIDEKILDTSEVIKLLKIDRVTVYKLIKNYDDYRL